MCARLIMLSRVAQPPLITRTHHADAALLASRLLTSAGEIEISFCYFEGGDHRSSVKRRPGTANAPNWDRSRGKCCKSEETRETWRRRGGSRPVCRSRKKKRRRRRCCCCYIAQRARRRNDAKTPLSRRPDAQLRLHFSRRTNERGRTDKRADVARCCHRRNLARPE